MKELLTGWIVNLTLFSLLSSIVGKILPGKSYLPYIRVFCGIMMLLTLLQPILSVTGLEDEIEFSVLEDMFEIEMKQMENDLIRIEEKQMQELEEQYREYLEESDELESDGLKRED